MKYHDSDDQPTTVQDECCSSQGFKSMTGDYNPAMMMRKCFVTCRWLPLIPLTVGVIAFAVGYYVPAEILRIVWLTFAGIGILGGLVGLAIMSAMKKACE